MTGGYINALTNAKRAIDCQTDKIFQSVGLDPHKFPKIVLDFTKTKVQNTNAKLLFLQSLNFAPTGVISETRTLRNKLEHFYKKPTKKEVSSALELAELFLMATESKIAEIQEYVFTDKEKHTVYQIKTEDHTKSIPLSNCFVVEFNSELKRFEIRGFIGDSDVIGKNRRVNIVIDNTSIELYHLLKIATSFKYEEDLTEAMCDFLEAISHPIPRGNINVEMDFC